MRCGNEPPRTMAEAAAIEPKRGTKIQSRKSSLMLVLERVRSSTCLTITAQARDGPGSPFASGLPGKLPGTTTELGGTSRICTLLQATSLEARSSNVFGRATAPEHAAVSGHSPTLLPPSTCVGLYSALSLRTAGTCRRRSILSWRTRTISIVLFGATRYIRIWLPRRPRRATWSVRRPAMIVSRALEPARSGPSASSPIA